MMVIVEIRPGALITNQSHTAPAKPFVAGDCVLVLDVRLDYAAA